MKLNQALLIAVLAIFAFTGCANPFLTNVYSKIGLGGQSLPELSNSNDVVDALKKSDSFVDQLNPTQVEEVKQTLKDSVQGPVDNQQEQETVLALSKVTLKSSGAGEVVKNVNNLVGDILAKVPTGGSGGGDSGSGSGDDSSDLGEMFKEPTKLLGKLFGDDPASIQTQIQGFVESAEALNSYGQSLTTTGAPSSVSEAEAGNLAATAAISGIVSTMVSIHPSGNAQQAVSDLASFLADPTQPSPYTDGSVTLPKPAGSNPTPKEMLSAFMGNNPALTNVIDAGLNLDALANSFQGGNS